MKSYQYSALVLLGVALLGCKPKTTTLTGQIFIVTRGADNVKLGAVEVLLIEKPEAIKFLENKEAAIEAQKPALEEEVANAKNDLAQVQAAFDLFVVKGGHPATNADLLRVSAQVEERMREHRTLGDQWFSLNAQEEQARRQGNAARAAAIEKQQEAVFDLQRKKMAEANSLLLEVKQIVWRANAEETNRLKNAKARVTDTANRLSNFPTAEDYFSDFSLNASQRTFSDPDGRYSLVYPQNKQFSIFAKAKRETMGKTESYYWLVNAPKNKEKADAFLSNNNLVFVDPDGYFRIRPKH